MKHSVLIPVILSLTLLLSACANGPNKAGMGAAGGAAGGALIGQAIGHNTEATLIGAAIGTMLGYMIGNEMDKYDRQQLNHVYERGVSGQSNSWRNPDSGNQYSVTPQPAYSNPVTNQPCRQAEIKAIIDGRPQTTYTTACRDNNGNWQLQN
ncbi:MAG: glycine zipper 2TM domain-containing protein [Desulfocapsa sp.]|nr:glycine zipper 2TM domain-containing protein [Desulfocapsa sp.]MBN4048964.1 glycine zipper 2TM domain-containing protein [bacterium AH-315-N22]